MQLDQIYEIVSRWYSTGYISGENRELLRAQYLQEIDAQPGCTVCPDFYRDMQIHFRIQLKQNGFTVKKTERKYMIADGGNIRLFGEQKLIVNDGENTESTEVLTDAKAEALLKANPEFAELIIPNPDYKEPEETPAHVVLTDAEKEAAKVAKDKAKAEKEAAKDKAK